MNPTDVWQCPKSEDGKHHWVEVWDYWDHVFREKCLKCGEYTQD